MTPIRRPKLTKDTTEFEHNGIGWKLRWYHVDRSHESQRCAACGKELGYPGFFVAVAQRDWPTGPADGSKDSRATHATWRCVIKFADRYPERTPRRPRDI